MGSWCQILQQILIGKKKMCTCITRKERSTDLDKVVTPSKLWSSPSTHMQVTNMLYHTLPYLYGKTKHQRGKRKESGRLGTWDLRVKVTTT